MNAKKGVVRPPSRIRREAVRAAVLALITFAFVLGYAIRGRLSASTPSVAHTLPPGADAAEREVTEYMCAMHPQIRQPGPGRCLICGMDLVPVTSGTAGKPGENNPRRFVTSQAAKALMDIETTRVERRSVHVEIRMVGKIEHDETTLSHITAWMPGRLDRLHVDHTGIGVKQGDPMAEIYSPELVNAQEELIQAIKAAHELESSDVEMIRDATKSMVEAAREKLGLLGLSVEQVKEIEMSGTASDHVTLNAPMSGIVIDKYGQPGMYVNTGTRIYTIARLDRVWAKFDAYESDLVWVREGQEVEFTVKAYPGEVFTGRVAFIDPVLDERTRTVKVRVNVPNPEGRLKPGMLARAVVYADPAEGELSLVIPASAPLVTGKRAIVYVEVQGAESPTFEGREIVLGPRAGDYYLVSSGLREGDLVVTRGNFKIDSALQIQAKPSMMSPEGGTGGSVHVHGGSASKQTAQEVEHSSRPRPEFSHQAGRLLSDYLTLQSRLAEDDLEGATSAAARVLEQLGRADPTSPGAEQSPVWTDIRAVTEKTLRSMVAAGDIDSLRGDFSRLSESVQRAIETFAADVDGPVYVIRCPMAFQGRGGDWLQTDKDVRNPYFGASMLRCGEVIKTIPAATNAVEGGQSHE